MDLNQKYIEFTKEYKDSKWCTVYNAKTDCNILLRSFLDSEDTQCQCFFAYCMIDDKIYNVTKLKTQLCEDSLKIWNFYTYNNDLPAKLIQQKGFGGAVLTLAKMYAVKNNISKITGYFEPNHNFFDKDEKLTRVYKKLGINVIESPNGKMIDKNFSPDEIKDLKRQAKPFEYFLKNEPGNIYFGELPLPTKLKLEQ